MNSATPNSFNPTETMAAKTRARTVGGTCYRGPYGTPLAHVHYQQGRHLNPERTPFHHHERPVSIRLLDVSKETLENIRKVAVSIKRLLAPSLQLKTVPDSLVAYMEHLERLDLGHNRLTDASFPDAMKSLDKLVELSLNHNQLTRVPACLKRMRNLVRLNLSNNQLESVSGLERLKKLQFLVLDNNNLSTVFREVSGLRKLEMLRCSSNNLRDVPRDIKTLRHLKDLDLSNNRILMLPTDVFQLPKLEFLNASQNQVSKIPSFNVKVQNKHWISCVDLSDNHLVKFPGHLMHMSHKLDLSANKIRTLSWSSFKKLDESDQQELILDSNPIVYPPPDVCLSGLKTIVLFFQESHADVKTYQGVKILVMGSHRSGKSSLVYSLVDQQARLSEDITDTAAGIDAYEMSFDYDSEEGNPGTSLNLCLWDFCGSPFYLYPHYLFHEQPAITVLTFSLPDFTDHSFGQQIGSWFDWMIAKSNKLIVILVGTHSDRVSEKRAQTITHQVREKLAEHLQTRQEMLETRIKDIETRPVISPTLSEQLKTCMRLLQAKVTVQTEIIITSSKEYTGFHMLREAIEALAGNRKLFPHVMRVIPTFWVEVEHWVEERGNGLLVPVVGWEAYSEEVTQRFGMKHLLNAITQYLHDAGKVLWFSTVPSLKNLVFLRPAWLFDLLKLIFRHDLEAATFTPDDTLKVIGFTPSRFERLKQEFVRDGILDQELLKGLLVSLMPADIAEPTSEVMQLLTYGLEMGYPVSKIPQNLTYDYNKSDKETKEEKVSIQRLLLPWFRNCAEPTSFRHQWRALQSRRRLAVLFRFPSYMPPGLFEIMTVRVHREKHGLVFLAHWGGGIHAHHEKENVQLLMTYYADRSCGEKGEKDEEEKKDDVERDAENVVPGSNANSHGKVPKGKSEENTSRRTFMTSNSKGPVNRPRGRNLTNTSRASEPADTKPRRQQQQDTDSTRPASIQEIDEDEEDDEEDEEEDEEETEEFEDSRETRNSMDSNSDQDFEDTSASAQKPGQTVVRFVDRQVGDSDSSSAVASRQRHTTRKEKVRDQPDNSLPKKPTETEENSAGNIVLKFELRDNSEDEEDQIPVASMWNVLLPLLMDFEDLLQQYTGVLVERRTQCPYCGEGTFPGEWLTPKETQSLDTRRCDSCMQQVDTTFLVQPREKKRDDVMRTLIRRHVRRRGAAVTSDIEEIHKVAPPNPRRAAFVTLDIAGGSFQRLMGLRESLGEDLVLSDPKEDVRS